VLGLLPWTELLTWNGFPRSIGFLFVGVARRRNRRFAGFLDGGIFRQRRRDQNGQGGDRASEDRVCYPHGRLSFSGEVISGNNCGEFLPRQGPRGGRA
jgi:hypothetical protein